MVISIQRWMRGVGSAIAGFAIAACSLGQRVRDVRQGPDGLLYILTGESEDGRLIRLKPTGD